MEEYAMRIYRQSSYLSRHLNSDRPSCAILGAAVVVGVLHFSGLGIAQIPGFAGFSATGFELYSP